MKKFVVIGHPINHSKSPAIHMAAMHDLRISADFLAVDVLPDNLSHWFSKNISRYVGLAVTIPHKESVMPFLNSITPEAKAIGAVNTIFWNGKKIAGTNTDWIGALQALKTAVPHLPGKSALVLGGGGAARAILYALKKSNITISLWNRTAEKAQKLASEFTDISVIFELEKTLFGTQDIIINTTSVGMDSCESIISADFWRSHQTAMDIVYSPPKTQFLSNAESAGATIVTGEKMLLFQAMEQFRIWHGITPKYEIMQSAMKK